LVVGRLWILIEKRFRAEDHATQTEPALRRLFVDECLLNRVRLLRRAQAFQRHNLRVTHSTHGRDAGAHRAPVHEDRTRAALTQPATEFWSPQMQFVSEHVKQRGFRIHIYRVDTAVDF